MHMAWTKDLHNHFLRKLSFTGEFSFCGFRFCSRTFLDFGVWNVGNYRIYSLAQWLGPIKSCLSLFFWVYFDHSGQFKLYITSYNSCAPVLFPLQFHKSDFKGKWPS